MLKLENIECRLFEAVLFNSFFFFFFSSKHLAVNIFKENRAYIFTRPALHGQLERKSAFVVINCAFNERISILTQKSSTQNA